MRAERGACCTKDDEEEVEERESCERGRAMRPGLCLCLTFGVGGYDSGALSQPGRSMPKSGVHQKPTAK